MDLFHSGDDVPRAKILVLLYDLGAFSDDRKIHFGHTVRQKCVSQEAER